MPRYQSPPLTLLIAFLLLFLSGAQLGAQSLFDRLHRPSATEVVDIVLTVPVDSLLNDTRHDQPATFTYADSSGSTRHLGVEVSLRGKFRRTRCSTPPLKLNFSKKELRAAGLAEHDKFKLVNTCFEDSLATTLLLKEYLAYRAYALLSPAAHYRTQLLRLTLRDLGGGHPDQTAWAFIIEDTDEMAARAGGHEVDTLSSVDAERFDPEAEATHALFQYLIGNADWSLAMDRNVKIVQRPEGELVPVGYDFDFSGWVGAPYATPASDHGQQSIYHRVYLGYGQSDRVLRRVSQDFRGHRRELLSLIEDFDLISTTERKILYRYVQRFYDELATISSTTGVLFYDQLRGATAEVIPPGSQPHHFRASTRR
ncbi:hypothetical protein [Neolewinella litorea]|uniref:CotH protein n=1 Tax=Neolewinella litorea TaxID=2562452 RepID=A0A4S4N726_9BACT|nr:hypothetical protein [Neolewinella litorea]THH34956.1 hypothetical protein E4021_16710 [Neolewinella litorea]